MYNSENNGSQILCDYETTNAFVSPTFLTKCLLCNEEMVVNATDTTPTVCEQCKQAWLKMRDMIENLPEKDKI